MASIISKFFPLVKGKLATDGNFSLTGGIDYGIVIEHLEGRTIHAGVAELVDARDLKSCVPKERAGSTPVSGTINFNIAGWGSWQLVGLITRRSQVQILSPQPEYPGRIDVNGKTPMISGCLGIFCSTF